jgi:hypothetical protein
MMLDSCFAVLLKPARVLLLLSFAVAGVLPFPATNPLHAAPYICGRFDPGGPTSPPTECSPGVTFTPVPASVFAAANPIFNDHFDVFVCWDWEAAGAAWNADSLRAFAAFIVHPGAGEEGLAKTILDYFGEDTDPSLDHFAVTTILSGSNPPADQT